MSVPAQLEHLGLLREAVQQLAAVYQSHPCRPSPQTLYAWGLAVYEAGTNVVLHGYDGGSQAPLYLVIDPRADHVVFQLEDAGRPNERWEAPVASSPWDEHGRGLATIRRIMHEASYGRAAEGHNVLRLVARLEATS